MEGLAAKYSKDVDFVYIYIKEAHACEGWDLAEETGVSYHDPQTLKARMDIARDFKRDKKIQVSMFVDDLDNKAAKLYAAFPERLYILQNNTIVYMGGRGPGDYHPSQVAEWLAKHYPNA